MGTSGPEAPLPSDLGPSPSTGTLTRNESRSHLQSRLSYIWSTNDSMFDSDVDRWIGGDTSTTHAAIPLQNRLSGSAPPRPTFAQTPLSSSGFWYVAAMVLPLMNLNVCRNWRCTPSSLLNTAEMMLTQVAEYCTRARSRLRRMAHEQGARDLFAGAMDVILVVYAIGFLLLSMYQASVFHQF